MCIRFVHYGSRFFCHLDAGFWIIRGWTFWNDLGLVRLISLSLFHSGEDVNSDLVLLFPRFIPGFFVLFIAASLSELCSGE